MITQNAYLLCYEQSSNFRDSNQDVKFDIEERNYDDSLDSDGNKDLYELSELSEETLKDMYFALFKRQPNKVYTQADWKMIRKAKEANEDASM